MMFYTTRPLQFLFPQIRWKGPTDHVYLTFDDGPHPVATPFVLQELAQHNIKATFFLQGSNVRRFPDLARQIVSQGHTIGNHTYDHPSLLFKDAAFIADQITKTHDIIRECTGITARYFRPPYGHGSPSVYQISKSHRLEVVLWDVDSGDWESRPPASIVSRSVGATSPGSILLFHDNEYTQHKIGVVLRPFISLVRSRSLRFSALPA